MRRPRLRLPLSLLLGLLAVLAVTGQPATAHAATAAETRVGASALFSTARTGLAVADVVDTQRANSAAYDDHAVGDLLAADEAASSGTTLFRAVGPDEAADIANTGGYRIAGNSVRGGKYFYPTQEQAQSLVDRGWATQVTSATFPQEAIDAATPLNIATEGPGYYIPEEFFPYGPVSFLGGPG